MHSRRIRLIISCLLLILFAAMVWLVSPSQPAFTRQRVRLRLPPVGTIAPGGYSWISQEEILANTQGENGASYIVWNVNTGSRRTIPHVDQILAKYPSKDSWSFSAHNGWLLFEAETESGDVTCLTKLDGSETREMATRHQFDGPPFWMHKQFGWLDIGLVGGTINNGLTLEQSRISAEFMPVLPIGFVTNDIFLSATNDLSISKSRQVLYPDYLDLEYWRLEARPVLTAAKRVRIHGDQIVSARSSPDGSHIVWVCRHSLPVPKLALDRRFPFFSFEPPYSIRLFESSYSAEQFSLLASLPTLGDFPIQWTPDSKSISFDYEDSLYLLEVDN